MTSPLPLVSAPPSVPKAGGAPPRESSTQQKCPFSLVPSTVVQIFLEFADNLKAAATCKSLQGNTEKLIERLWRKFDLEHFPNIKRALTASQSPRVPKTFLSFAGLLGGGIYDGILQKCTKEGRSYLAIDAKKQLIPSFRPKNFQLLEDAAKSAENNKNLERIWPRIARALNQTPKKLNSTQIKAWFRSNPNELAQIEHLDLSELGLTMIPEEFSSLAMPRLAELYLSKNKLKTLPANFGSNWNQLENLFLTNNQLDVLPADFGSNWQQLQRLYLSGNQLNALPADFGRNWNRLELLWLNDNQLRALPENFGSNWNRFRGLFLSVNQLNALPANFGSNWQQFSELRLNYNQLNALSENFGRNWNRLELLWLNDNQLDALSENFGNNWNQLQQLLLNNNQLNALPKNFGRNWNHLQRLSLNNNQLNVLSAIFGRNWYWWNEILARNPILASIQLVIPLASACQKLQKALLSAQTLHVLSTAALCAIASYAVSWKITGTLGALYLSHRMIRG